MTEAEGSVEVAETSPLGSFVGREGCVGEVKGSTANLSLSRRRLLLVRLRVNVVAVCVYSLEESEGELDELEGSEVVALGRR